MIEAINTQTLSLDHLVFDIETVPDAELYDPPADTPVAERPMAPLPAQRVIAIGTAWFSPDYRLKCFETLGEPDDERGMVRAFVERVDVSRPRLVSFAGRGFDLPVLLMRALRHGLAVPWYFDSLTYRSPAEDGHVDLSEAFGRVRHFGLKAAVRLIGLPGKLEVDGSQVEALHLQGQQATIDSYCLMDVAQTAFLLLRLRLLQGALSLDAYRRAARALHDQLRADSRLQTLLAAVDLDRLLLRETEPQEGRQDPSDPSKGH